MKNGKEKRKNEKRKRKKEKRKKGKEKKKRQKNPNLNEALQDSYDYPLIGC